MSSVGVVLPDELAYVLDLIGVAWPNVDEDDYREMATSLRDFADDIDGGAMEAHTAVQELLGANAGAAMDAFEAHWGKVKGTHLANLGEAARMGAVALDGVAIAIEVAKGAAIVQLGILAAEIVATIASAPFTLGLSSFAGAAATQATRMIVKKIFREVINQVVDQLMSIATAPIYAALESMAADLVIQVGSNALGLQKGVDLGRTADAGKEGFGEGVDGAKKQADSFTLASAGGGGGAGSGGSSAGGTGGAGSHFQSDGDSFDRADTQLDGITRALDTRSSGHMARARSARGRTSGRGEIAERVLPLATDVVEGIGRAATSAIGHVQGDMRRGLRQMHRNHDENDRTIADELDGISRRGGSEGPRRDQPAESGTGSDSGSGSGNGAPPAPSANPELDKLRRPRRPTIRKKSQFAVFRDAQRTSNGEDFICPNSGKTIPCERDSDGNAIRYDDRGRVDPEGFTRPRPNPPSNSGQPQNFHFGHVPDSEFRRLVELVEDNPKKFTWKQILNEYNDPSHYQVEDPSTNVGHGSESSTPGYGHYGGMLDRAESTGAGTPSPFG
ncbi:HNH/ENDO VII superfamily nuclease with conserved GHE residues [Actinacidiphila glaucinigra]|uniref:HNH/ENDO VII superfamily nuclease with conserved GHE residues n=1 Tax=Actinacidiphila glaucinigra TaxID=235986 RepID=A0A239J7E7_9ACTN|nr:HNH/ENDO VII superfamily nuclease with conserved GHE residues [Actinacidiphila glaucinigra]